MVDLSPDAFARIAGLDKGPRPRKLLTQAFVAGEIFGVSLQRFYRMRPALQAELGFPAFFPGTKKFDPKAIALWQDRFLPRGDGAAAGRREGDCEVYDLNAIRAALHESLDAELGASASARSPFASSKGPSQP